MKYASTKNLLTLVESANERGFITLREATPIRCKEQARERLLSAFMDMNLVTVRLDHVKKAISEIEPSWCVTENGNELTLNLAKLLLLPAAAPPEELAAFREMLLEMQAFFKTHEKERVDIQLCNNRDRNGRVYGTLRCRVPAGERKMAADESATDALNARIVGNTALSHWLRQVALALQKLGPHSWCCIREDELFGCFEGPNFEYRRSLSRPQAETDSVEKHIPLNL
jgi:O6-methylguanine-DNA--protein-cysteine methyltransferase